MRRLPTLLLLLAAAAPAACAAAHDPLAPGAETSGAPFLTTDSAEYVLRQEGSMLVVHFQLSYTNPLRVPVAVPACHSPAPPLLQKLVDGEWVLAHAPVMAACITPPLVVPARATHRFQHFIHADEWERRRWPTNPDGSLDGTYRLYWFVGVGDRRADTGVGRPLADELVVSNTFTLRSAAR